MANSRTAYLPLATYPDIVPDEAIGAAVSLAAGLECDLHVLSLIHI